MRLKPSKSWVAPAVAGTVGLLLGAAIWSGGSTPQQPVAQSEPEPAPTVTVTETVDPTAQREEELDNREHALDVREEAQDTRTEKLDQREAEITEQEIEIEEGTIPGPGIYLVGEDIQPGNYRTNGDDCYYARLSGLSGEIDDIITNGFAIGPTVLTIEEADVAFENGCGEWTLQH